MWKPVVLLSYKVGEEEKEASAELNLRICTSHKRSLGDGQFVSIVYKSFSERIREMNVEVPPESAGRVRWDKWHLGIITVDS